MFCLPTERWVPWVLLIGTIGVCAVLAFILK